MKEQGIIIFEDGTALSFGKHVCTNEIEYLNSPEHKDSFKNEILSDINFKLSGLTYDSNKSYYENLLAFSLEGIISIINNQLTTDAKTEILSYVPILPTEEQLNSLKAYEELSNIEIQRVYEFQTFDWDDYIEYEDLEDYISSKSQTKKV